MIYGLQVNTLAYSTSIETFFLSQGSSLALTGIVRKRKFLLGHSGDGL